MHAPKTFPFVTLAALLVAALAMCTVSPLAAAEAAPPARTKSGTSFQNADLARVARAWERLVGGTVTVEERARSRRVTLTISAPTAEEFRKAFVAALRENGIVVVERDGGVAFELPPEIKGTK